MKENYIHSIRQNEEKKKTQLTWKQSDLILDGGQVVST